MVECRFAVRLKADTTSRCRSVRLQPDMSLAGCFARSSSIRSRIAIATRSFDCSGSVSGPPAPTIVTAFVSTSKPASSRDTSLATIRSTLLRLALGGGARHHVLGFRGKADEQRTAAAGRPARAEVGENIRRLPEHERQLVVALGDLLLGAPLRRVVGDRGGHDRRRRRARHAAAPRRASRPRRGRERPRSRAAARSRSGRRSASPRRRGAPLRRPAQSPSARSSGCRRTGPDRDLRRSVRRSRRPAAPRSGPAGRSTVSAAATISSGSASRPLPIQPHAR